MLVDQGHTFTGIAKAKLYRRLSIPFFQSLVHAGSFAPATDYVEKACDLNDLLIKNIDTTYFVGTIGDCMAEDGLWEGDIMIVDRALTDYEGRIVVGWLYGELLVRRFHKKDEFVVLMPANRKYEPIYLQEVDKDNFKMFGVVHHWIKKAPVKRIFEL